MTKTIRAHDQEIDGEFADRLGADMDANTTSGVTAPASESIESGCFRLFRRLSWTCHGPSGIYSPRETIGRSNYLL